MNMLQTILQTILNFALNFAGPLGIGAILGIVIKHFLDKDRIKTDRFDIGDAMILKN